jgi:hypothetical protein
MSAATANYQPSGCHHASVNKKQTQQSPVDKQKDELCLKIAAYLRANTEISARNHELLIGILRHHPQWETKSTNMKRIAIIDNHGIHKFAVERHDGTFEEIDYRKAIYGKEVIDNIKFALLRHITCKISTFIASRYAKHTNNCDYCECLLTSDNSCSMFASPSFQYLTEGFMQQIELPIIYTRISRKSGKLCIATKQIRDAWDEYFDAHGKLLFVCHDCMKRHYYNTK